MRADESARADDLTLSELTTQVPHLEQYFGPWAIMRDALDSRLRTLDWSAMSNHIRLAGVAQRRNTPRPLYEDRDGVAVVELFGTMTKYGSSLSGAPGSQDLAGAIGELAGRDDVRAIVLRIDSPGGTVAGTGDLADAVHAAAQRKEVVAVIEDLAASAAYWVASQATSVVANPSAYVGSIGAYTVLRDWSGADAARGVRTHVVRSGRYKGVGEPGAPIDTDDLADVQRVVDAAHGLFVAAVARGRGTRLSGDQLEDLADGRVWIAGEAVGLGLIDQVGTFETVMGGLVPAKPQQKQQRSVRAMSNTEERVAATYQDLKALLPGADAEFICAQLERQATVDQAQSAWMEEQQRRIAEAETKAEQAKAEAAAAVEAASKRPGVEPLTEGAPAEPEPEDPVARFEAQVAERVKAGRTRAQAVRDVVVSDPDLHREYLAAHNTARG